MAALRAAAFGRPHCLRQGFDCPIGSTEKGHPHEGVPFFSGGGGMATLRAAAYGRTLLSATRVRLPHRLH